MRFWRTSGDPERKFWPLFNVNNIFLALLKYQTLYNIILGFSNFVRGQWQGIWISAQFLYVFGKKRFFMPILSTSFFGIFTLFQNYFRSCKICRHLQTVISKESGFGLSFSMFLSKNNFHGHFFNLFNWDFFIFFKTISVSRDIYQLKSLQIL